MELGGHNLKRDSYRMMSETCRRRLDRRRRRTSDYSEQPHMVLTLQAPMFGNIWIPSLCLSYQKAEFDLRSWSRAENSAALRNQVVDESGGLFRWVALFRLKLRPDTRVSQSPNPTRHPKALIGSSLQIFRSPNQRRIPMKT